MMGRQEAPAQLFYEFDLEQHVPANHMLREIDLFLDGDGLREVLRPFYSHLGRPSIDPELIIRMLVIGYAMGIRSERRLCDEVHLNLAYRWFCRLGLEGKRTRNTLHWSNGLICVRDHSRSDWTFTPWLNSPTAVRTKSIRTS